MSFSSYHGNQSAVHDLWFAVLEVVSVSREHLEDLSLEFEIEIYVEGPTTVVHPDSSVFTTSPATGGWFVDDPLTSKPAMVMFLPGVLGSLTGA